MLNCDCCGKGMIFDYQVEERQVLFKLWNCECGNRTLERKNLRRLRSAVTMSPLSGDLLERGF